MTGNHDTLVKKVGLAVNWNPGSLNLKQVIAGSVDPEPFYHSDVRVSTMETGPA